MGENNRTTMRDLSSITTHPQHQHHQTNNNNTTHPQHQHHLWGLVQVSQRREKKKRRKENKRKSKERC